MTLSDQKSEAFFFLSLSLINLVIKKIVVNLLNHQHPPLMTAVLTHFSQR